MFFHYAYQLLIHLINARSEGVAVTSTCGQSQGGTTMLIDIHSSVYNVKRFGRLIVSTGRQWEEILRVYVDVIRWFEIGCTLQREKGACSNATHAVAATLEKARCEGSCT